MNIAEVLGWKFNNQEGIECREIKGVLTLTKFSGGLPSPKDLAQWEQEYLTFKSKENKRNAILEKLKVLDFKRIRSVSEGDLSYLAMLNSEVLALRAELSLL